MGVELFSYGSLEQAELLQALTGLRFEKRPAVLEGHRRGWVSGEVYPGVVAEPGARTPGSLYRDLDPQSLAVLDAFEGHLYERRRLPVRLAAGGRIVAHVYVVTRALVHRVSRVPWDGRRFEREHAAAFRDLCRDFAAGWRDGRG